MIALDENLPIPCRPAHAQLLLEATSQFLERLVVTLEVDNDGSHLSCSALSLDHDMCNLFALLLQCIALVNLLLLGLFGLYLLVGGHFD